jgi:GNAT superfamily N-acetyltransferase
MKLRDANTRDAEAVHRLLVAGGWAHRVGTAEQCAALVAASQRAVVAVVEDEVVGFARGITDGLSNGYLSMVVVSPHHQRHGIGRALVERVVGSNGNVTWVLRAGRPGAEQFFSKLGFSASSVAMERVRGQGVPHGA